MPAQSVFIQSNEPDTNRLFAFRRADDGQLLPSVAVATGGRGDGVAHVTSQGSVVLTRTARGCCSQTPGVTK